MPIVAADAPTFQLPVTLEAWFEPELLPINMFIAAVSVVVAVSVFWICKTLIDIFAETREYFKFNIGLEKVNTFAG